MAPLGRVLNLPADVVKFYGTDIGTARFEPVTGSQNDLKITTFDGGAGFLDNLRGQVQIEFANFPENAE